MKTANKINQAVNNIRYYASEIQKASKEQFEEDASVKDMNTQVGCIRFDSLGCIGIASNWIAIYCDNIEANLKMAVEQDKLLETEEEDAY